ncbi:MAG: Omp28-related outer membrane protein [Muribaculaceae bacterium]
MKKQLLALSACALVGASSFAATSPIIKGGTSLGEGRVKPGITVNQTNLNANKPAKAPTDAESDLFINWGYCNNPYNAYPFPAGELKGAIKMTSDVTTDFAGAQITEIMVGNPTKQDYTNPIKTATVWISESLNGEPIVSTSGKLGSKAFEWSSINLETPYTIEAGKEIYIGYTITVPKGNGIYGLITDNYKPQNNESAYVYSTFEGVDNRGNLKFGDNYSWQAVGEYFGNLSIQAKVIGDQLPTNMAVIPQAVVPSATTANTPFNVKLYAVNIAANAVKDIDVTFEVAGEDAQVKNIKLQKDIYYGEASEEKAQFVCEQIGTLDYKLYISAVNGEPCDTGYALTGNILSLESGFKRNLVFEEGTGTWCGWCVVGYAGMEYMKETYGDKGFIGIAVHQGDAMASLDRGGAYASFGQYFDSFPSAFLNRDWSADIYPDPYVLEEEYEALINVPAIVEISAEISGESIDSRDIKLKTKTQFCTDSDNVNYGIAYAVVEDNVGPYPQQNNASGQNRDFFGFEKKGKVVPLTFNDVARNCSHPEAFKGSIPTEVKVGETYEYTMDINLSDVKDLENYRVIAMVIDNKTGQIQNACQATNILSGVESVIGNESSFVANGGKGWICVSCDTPANIYNASGRMVAEGVESGVINVPAGVYIVNANGKSVKVLVF